MRILSRFLIAWLITSVFVLLFSCTPQRRLERLQSRHAYLFNQVSDTIRIQDTVNVMIPGTAVDTFFAVRDLHDTVYFAKDNLHVKAYVYNDTLYLEAKTDTIFKTVTRELKVPVTKYVYSPKARDKLRWVYPIVVSVLLLVVYLLARHQLRSY